MTNNEDLNVIPSIDNLEVIRSNSLIPDEINKLDGVKVKVANAVVTPDESKYDEEGEFLPEGQTRQVYVVVTETEPFGESIIGRNITVKEKFSLKKDQKTGNWGVSHHEKSKSKKFFVKLGVNGFKETIGKTIVVVKKVSPTSGRAFLSFSI